MSQLRQESLAAVGTAWFSVWLWTTDIIYTAIPGTPDGRIPLGPSLVRSWLPGSLDFEDRRLARCNGHQVVEYPFGVRSFGSLRQPHVSRGAVGEDKSGRPEDTMPGHPFLVVAREGRQDPGVRDVFPKPLE